LYAEKELNNAIATPKNLILIVFILFKSKVNNNISDHCRSWCF
jgi:hypothetical protein